MLSREEIDRDRCHCRVIQVKYPSEEIRHQIRSAHSIQMASFGQELFEKSRRLGTNASVSAHINASSIVWV